MHLELSISSGVYLLGDRTVHENGPRRLSAFGQFGIGDARNDRFARYFGAGVVMAAPFDRRSQDELGLAVAAARNSGVYNIEKNALNGETAVECTYLAPLSSHIAVQPDFQYVIHPNADPSRKNAVVLQLHFEISR